MQIYGRVDPFFPIPFLANPAAGHHQVRDGEVGEEPGGERGQLGSRVLQTQRVEGAGDCCCPGPAHLLSTLQQCRAVQCATDLVPAALPAHHLQPGRRHTTLAPAQLGVGGAGGGGGGRNQAQVEQHQQQPGWHARTSSATKRPAPATNIIVKRNLKGHVVINSHCFLVVPKIWF